MRTAFRITTIYLIFGVLWILLSDLWLFNAYQDTEIISSVQNIKGILFVAISTLIIYLVSKRELDKAKKAEEKALEEKRKARELSIQAEEKERNRIAMDLHDGIQQRLDPDAISRGAA